MANTLRFKRGLVSGIPTAALGEPLFTTDTFDLYIGNGTGNTRFQKYIASGTTSQILRGDGSLYTFPLAISSPTTGQVLKYNGTSWVNDSDSGITGSGANGQVAFFTGATTQSGSNNLFWDATNNRLGIGTATPLRTLHVNGGIGVRVGGYGVRNSTQSANSGFIQVGSSDNLYGMLDFNAFDSNTIFEVSNTNANNNAELRLGGGFVTIRTGATPAERARMTSGGNLLLGSSTDNGQRLQVTGDGYFSGSVGIGTTALTGYNVRVSKSITGGINASSIVTDSTIQSDVNNIAHGYYSGLSTAAASFTLSNLRHFYAEAGAFGAGSSVTTQIGFGVSSNLTGATNNYGFYGNIASGTGRWNLYLNGTANNYMAGSLGIGTSSLLDRYNLNIAKNVTGAASSGSIINNVTIQSDVTANAYLVTTAATTQAATFTLANLYMYRAGGLNLGTNSTVTNLYAFAALSGNIGATNNYGFFGDIASGTGRWNLYLNGTANNYMAGSLGIGTTGLSNTNLSVNKNLTGLANVYGIFNSGSIRSDVTTGAQMFTSAPSIQNAVFTLAGLKHFEAVGISSVGSATITTQFGFYVESTLTGATTNYGFYSVIAAATGRWNLFMDGTANNFMRGSLLIGSSTTSTGEALQVNGTMRVSGASTFNANATISLNQNNGTRLSVSNTTAGTLSSAEILLTSDASSGTAQLGKYSSTTTAFKILTPSSLFLYNPAAGGDIAILNNAASGTIKMAAGGSSTAQFTIDSTGAATFSSSIQAATAIAIGTTPDTNKPFKILKNINGTVGINFENTSTGSSAFSAIQMGTDVSGGTKFANLVYASSGVSASGVYQPDGTSLINNGSGGLNFLGTPIRFFTSTGNGTLRWLFDNEGAIQFTTTAPTTSATDGYKQYSADITAGNAAPHFRTENGAIIKLYQETTAVGNSTISVGGGNAVLDDTEFDGYTLRQIVRALRNQGILQ